VNAAHVRHMSARYMLTGAMVTSFAPALPEM